MSELELHREYITRLAEEIKELKVENKDIKKELEHLQNWITEKCQENKALKESRDELLEVLQEIAEYFNSLHKPPDEIHLPLLNSVIKIQKALKEKA